MNSTIPLGRWAGVPVGLHWSVALTVVLIASSLAESVLPDLDPGETRTTYWVAGVLIAVVFFASLIAHELAHTLVARRNGVQVDSITLWLLGGVSRFDSEPDDPGVELRLSLAGPAMSLLLGASWWALAALASVVGAPSIWVNSLLWLAFINLVLAVFNMMPAFPLDGGRVLRAILWRQSDRLGATRIAVGVGRVFAFMLVGFGVLLVFSGALVSGVWFMLLGWFVEVAGRAEEASTMQQDLVRDATVAEIMSAPVATVSPDLEIDAFLHDHVLRDHHNAFPVLRDGAVVGMVGLENLRKRSSWSVQPDAAAVSTVGEIATPLFGVPILEPGSSLTGAMDEMARLGVSRALVLEAGQLVGIVTHTDLVRALQVHSLETARSGDSS
jgi:Zn-dependent protease/predicted transcriptional regulator